MSIWARLNARREVWRPSMVSDGMGGYVRTFTQVGEERCKIDVPSAKEREEAAQWAAEFTHSVYLLPRADVKRGDELRGGEFPLRVVAIFHPSHRRYLKASCQAIEPEGE